VRFFTQIFIVQQCLDSNPDLYPNPKFFSRFGCGKYLRTLSDSDPQHCSPGTGTITAPVPVPVPVLLANCHIFDIKFEILGRKLYVYRYVIWNKKVQYRHRRSTCTRTTGTVPEPIILTYDCRITDPHPQWTSVTDPGSGAYFLDKSPLLILLSNYFFYLCIFPHCCSFAKWLKNYLSYFTGK
jgi:hypothetical protein